MYLGWRSTQDAVDLVDLVDLVLARKKWVHGDHLKHDAADAPQVHSLVVIAVGEQTLWGTIPPCGDVLGVRLLGVDAAARTKVGHLEGLVRDKDIFRLDIAVEDAVASRGRKGPVR